MGHYENPAEAPKNISMTKKKSKTTTAPTAGAAAGGATCSREWAQESASQRKTHKTATMRAPPGTTTLFMNVGSREPGARAAADESEKDDKDEEAAAVADVVYDARLGQYANNFDTDAKPEVWPFSCKVCTTFCGCSGSGAPRDYANEEMHVPEIGDPEQCFRVTWLGHATVLVQMEGMSFLTDPTWAARRFPQWWGCCVGGGHKRVRAVPIDIDQLPRLDFIVVSHVHPGHIDVDTVRRLETQFGSRGLTWFVPDGVGDWMARQGVKLQSVQQLKWGDSHDFRTNIGRVIVLCLPAQHGSQWTCSDVNQSLWCSWAVIGPRRRVFFAGETGACVTEFARVGEAYGPFDVALLPLGSTSPPEYFADFHLSTTEAIEVHKALGARRSFGISWGTFELWSKESVTGARDVLAATLAALPPAVAPKHPFATVPIGETQVLDRAPAIDRDAADDVDAAVERSKRSKRDRRSARPGAIVQQPT